MKHLERRGFPIHPLLSGSHPPSTPQKCTLITQGVLLLDPLMHHSWPRSHPTGHFYFPGWHLKIELCLSLAPENDTSSGRTMARPILGRAGLGGAQRYLEVCVFKTLKKFRINWVRYESSDCRSSRKSKALQMKWCWAFLAQSSDITPGGPRCALSLKSKGAPQVSFACSEDWLCNLQIPVQNEKWAPCSKISKSFKLAVPVLDTSKNWALGSSLP